ncbi:MAG: hypothetical protein HC880_17340 [Bacteroidia bacterium]|nr:hypothetical protein [Bacteroidia bacterium]
MELPHRFDEIPDSGQTDYTPKIISRREEHKAPPSTEEMQRQYMEGDTDNEPMPEEYRRRNGGTKPDPITQVPATETKEPETPVVENPSGPSTNGHTIVPGEAFPLPHRFDAYQARKEKKKDERGVQVNRK